MESNQPLDSHLEPGLQVSGEIIHYLKQCATWGQVVAIAGFITSALLLVYAFFVGAIFGTVAGELPTGYGSIMASVMTGAFLVSTALILIPSIYLFRFASRARMAVLNENSEDLAGAMASLKSFFKFIGIVIIIYFGLIFLVFLLAGVTGGFQ